MTPPPPRLESERPQPSRWATGVGAFADHYDLWLVDQWGVLHDGRRPFPGVIEALQRLQSRGKRVVVLSNSGKRAAVNVARLTALGIPAELYTALMTSGELARTKLSQRAAPFDAVRGRRCLLLGSDRDHSVVDGLDIERVPVVGEAEFILLIGVDDTLPPAYYRATLELGRAGGLPLVCANPDLVRFTERGLQPSAGEFARLYEELGGTVYYIGKPYPDIYTHCLQLYGTPIAGRTIAVGDSLHHDVTGGSRAGLATALVAGGIHRHALSGLDTDAARRERLEELSGHDGTTPDWVIPSFRWS